MKKEDELNEHSLPRVAPCSGCDARMVSLVISFDKKLKTEWKHVCSKCGKQSTSTKSVLESILLWNEQNEQIK